MHKQEIILHRLEEDFEMPYRFNSRAIFARNSGY